MIARGLHHRNPLIRKASAQLLQIPKQWARVTSRAVDFEQFPPVLANSFPKSGTHLLDQIAAGLPHRREYGAFLSSMTSSFQFRRRTPTSVLRFVRAIVPGELVRAHLFYDRQYAAELAAQHVVHFFIYRDPRDVVVSDTHYLREMNRWHRMHRHFRALPTLDDAITFAIRGFEQAPAGLYYPSIAERFSCYEGWLHDDSCFAVRFEDLVSDQALNIIRRMTDFYAQRCQAPLDKQACAARMYERIAPEKSHTYRSGQRGGWRAEFNGEHRRLFAKVAGDLLSRLGYEQDDSWIRDAPTADHARQT